MEKWRKMNGATLALSAMWSAISAVQKCQAGLERFREVESALAQLESKKKELQAALAAKNEQLVEEARKKDELIASLHEAMAEVEKQKVVAATQERLADDLIYALNKEKEKSKSDLAKQNFRGNSRPKSTLPMTRGSVLFAEGDCELQSAGSQHKSESLGAWVESCLEEGGGP